MKLNISAKIRLSVIFALVGILLIAGTSMAAEFSASVTQKMTNPQMGSMDMSGKIYVKGIIQRQEMKGPMGAQIIIIRPDKGKVWIVMPSTKSYMEESIPKISPKSAPTMESMLKKMPNIKKVGVEKIGGYQCDKYKFNDTTRKASGTVWLSSKLKQELKSDINSQMGKMSMLLTNIKEGKQKDSLFNLPSGYKKQAMPDMSGGMPGGGGGMPGMPK
ncbi:MAG: DUF4412 domain-containing protein [Armatimonadota bacterium]